VPEPFRARLLCLAGTDLEPLEVPEPKTGEVSAMTPMMMLLGLLGVLAAVLVVLLIYRSTLEMHEDDQLFLDSAESHMAKEQEDLQKKLGKIEPMLKWLGAACIVLGLTAAGLWLYQGLTSSGGLR
jgi:beta-lactamase regulating signal transducer with metallopeptidase domain